MRDLDRWDSTTVSKQQTFSAFSFVGFRGKSVNEWNVVVPAAVGSRAVWRNEYESNVTNKFLYIQPLNSDLFFYVHQKTCPKNVHNPIYSLLFKYAD